MKRANQDGIDHINIYSKGETLLGRWMSNFTKQEIFVEDRFFDSIEAYWYWLGFDFKGDARAESLLQSKSGYLAKQFGQDLRKTGIPIRRVVDFEDRIKNAIRIKLDRSPTYKRRLGDSTLPFQHYYNFNGVIRDAGFQWIVDFWEDLRMELKN